MFWADVREYILSQVGDKHLVSYEEITDKSKDEISESHFEPTPVPSAEEVAIVNILLEEVTTKILATNELYGIILDMLLDGAKKKDIVEKLQYQKTYSYQKISEAIELFKRFYNESE